MLLANRLLKSLALSASLLLPQAAQAVTVNTFQFNGALSVSAGSITDPASLNFLPSFTILSQNGVIAGDLVGLTGNIAGDYEFNDPNGATSVALNSPTAPNDFTIFDGVETFTADVSLVELQGGGGGSVFGNINFASSDYAGVNPGLVTLNTLIQSGPNLTITFQTLGGNGVDLDELFQDGSNGVATYSAAVLVRETPTAVPEPMPLALLGLGLLCTAAHAYRRSNRRTKHA